MVGICSSMILVGFYGFFEANWEGIFTKEVSVSDKLNFEILSSLAFYLMQFWLGCYMNF